MQREVTEFIVVAPANQGKVVGWAAERLSLYLEAHFPRCRFRIEPFGPLAADNDFTVIPIMNRMPEPGEDQPGPDELIMCQLDPNAVPKIKQALLDFDLVGTQLH